MSITSPLPRRTRAVIRLGRPKAKSPICSTDRPLTWPTALPVVSTSRVSRSIASWMRSRTRSERKMRASIARSTSSAVTARWSASPAQ